MQNRNHRNNGERYVLASLTRNTSCAIVRLVVEDGAMRLFAVMAAGFRDGDNYYIIQGAALDEAYTRQLTNQVYAAPDVESFTTDRGRVPIRLAMASSSAIIKDVEESTPGGGWFIASFSKGTTTAAPEATCRQLQRETWRLREGASSQPLPTEWATEAEAFAAVYPTANAVMALASVQGGRHIAVLDDGRGVAEEINTVAENAQAFMRPSREARVKTFMSKLPPAAAAALSGVSIEDLLADLASGGGPRRKTRGGNQRNRAR